MNKLATIVLAALVIACTPQPGAVFESSLPPVTGSVSDGEAANPVPVVAGAPEPPPESASKVRAAKFLWTARGRSIAGLAKRSDGTFNEGLNLAVPQGTEIIAADAGKVAYAGDELKGYGNLVLIRHANCWVSAYAHA